MRATLLLASGLAVGAYGLRFALQEPRVIENIRPAKPSTIRTVVRPRQCPRPGTSAPELLGEVERETARTRRALAALTETRRWVGEPLPDSLLAPYQPDVVRPAVEAVLPASAHVEWRCDAFPCSLVAVFEPGDLEDARELSEAAGALFSDSTTDAVPIDGEGWVDHDGEPGAYAVHIRPFPETDTAYAGQLRFHQLLEKEASMEDRRALMDALSDRMR